MTTHTLPISGPLLNERQVASLLQCSVGLVRKWRCYSSGPAFIKLGGRLVRYRPEDVDAFSTEHRKAA